MAKSAGVGRSRACLRLPSAVRAAAAAALAGAALLGPLTPARAGPAGAPVTIMALGDSITYGMTAAGAATPGGYRGYLAQDLAGDGFPWMFVGSSEANAPLDTDPRRFPHEGHPYYRIDQIGAGLDGPDATLGAAGGYWMTGNAQHGPERPAVVVLHIGTNDIAQAYDPQGRYPGGYDSADRAERAQFVGHLAGRLEGLIAEIRRLDPRAAIVLCTIAPMGATTPDLTARDYDQVIRTRVMADERRAGAHIVLADVEQAFLSNTAGYHELVGPDGVHPTPMGYQTMAQAIAPAVEAVSGRH